MQFIALSVQEVSGKHAQQPLKYSPGNKHHLLFWKETVEWRMIQRDREDNAADDPGKGISDTECRKHSKELWGPWKSKNALY